MKKSRLEPFEILAANKRSNPLLASEGKAEAEPQAKRVRKKRAEAVPPTRQQDAQGSEVSSTPAGWFWRGVVRRSLLTVQVTPLRLAAISLLVVAAAGLVFLGGMRAGSKELPLPEQPPAGSFDEIRRNRVVLFDDLEVDRGPLRR